MKRQSSTVITMLILLLSIFQSEGYSQTTLTINASKDATIFSENTSGSNGTGSLFSGRVNRGDLRRALIQFDLSEIPSDAIVTNASVSLVGSRQSGTVDLFRLTKDFGEGSTSGTGNGGGNPSEGGNGDATWSSNFLNTSTWDSEGGDFEAQTRGSESINNGSTTTWSGDAVIEDVQSWINDESLNFGWILIGDETTNGSAVRINSRESGSNGPSLLVTFEVSDVCEVEGGTLTGGPFTFCVGDGIDDNIPSDGIALAGNTGSNSQWVVTDDQGTILGLPPSFDVVNFDGAGAGTCLVWHLSYDGEITGAEMGLNANDIEGCFSLSNPITVNRNQPEGGTLTGGPFTFCVGDGIDDNIPTDGITLTGNTGSNSQWVVTDDQGTILGLPPSFNVVNFDGAGAGTCLVWHLSYDGEIRGAEMGLNANDIQGCFSLSNPITVNRNTGSDCDCETSGGVIALEDGTTEVSICVDGIGDPLSVEFTTEGSGTNMGYVITDTENNILGLPMSGPFDLDGAGDGTCLIWAISYEDNFSGAEVGNNVSDLTGCYSLSNAITVYRQSPDGGTVSLADGSTEYANCAGDIVIDVQHSTQANMLSYWYIITDDNDNILAFANSANTSTLDLSGAPAGTCRIWGWSYRGEGDPVLGENISSLADGDCESISSNFITVYREIPDGGKIALADGTTSYSGTAGNIKVEVEHSTTAPNLSYWYVITDDNDNILAFANSANTSTLDLSGAPAGICRIWGWNYRGLDDPIPGDHISTLDDDECESLSANFVTVVREEAKEDIECNTPLNFRVRARSNRIFILDWDDVASAEKYQVQLRVEGTSKRFLISTNRNRMVIGTNLNRSIIAEVRSVCGDNNFSDFSDHVSFKADLSDGKGFGKSNFDQEDVDFEIDANLMTLSPNPASDAIHIDYRNTDFESQLNIVDITGRSVYNQFLAPNEYADQIDISQLENGIYQIIINSQGEIVDQQRFIKVSR